MKKQIICLVVFLVVLAVAVSAQTSSANDRLMTAATNGNLSDVRSALSAGANVNYTGKGATPLVWASINGHLEVVKYLVENGANLELVEGNGNSALIFASNRGHLEIVKYLVENGANLNLIGQYDRTALDWARAGDKTAVVEYLTTAVSKYDALFIDQFLRSNINGMEQILLDHSNQMDLNSLLYSVLFNYYGEIVQSEFRNPFYGNSNRQIALPVLRLLVRYGAYYDTVEYEYLDYYGRYEKRQTYGGPFNYLYLAIAGNLPFPVIEFLLESGASLNRGYHIEYGATPLNIALENENIRIARLLLEYGANVNETNSEEPILTRMAGIGKISSVRFLVENGAKVNESNPNAGFSYVSKSHRTVLSRGKTAAQVAYEMGEIDIYNYLVANGATWRAPGQGQVAQANPGQSSSSGTVAGGGSAAATGSSSGGYTPSAPAQTGSSSSGQTSAQRTTDAVVGALQHVQDVLRGSIDSGRYRISGGSEEISFTGIGDTGPLTYTDPNGRRSSGTYTISGNRITLFILGNYYFYTITSRTSFSGNGDQWVRVGY